LYILDEIDAALDNSHTENIGDIISSEFSNSQFVVVSLKEGSARWDVLAARLNSSLASFSGFIEIATAFSRFRWTSRSAPR
jgi:hypothetical protein